MSIQLLLCVVYNIPYEYRHVSIFTILLLNAFPLQSVEKMQYLTFSATLILTCTCFNVVCCTITTKNQLISFKLICIHCKNKALCVIRKGVK